MNIYIKIFYDPCSYSCKFFLQEFIKLSHIERASKGTLSGKMWKVESSRLLQRLLLDRGGGGFDTVNPASSKKSTDSAVASLSGPSRIVSDDILSLSNLRHVTNKASTYLNNSF